MTTEAEEIKQAIIRLLISDSISMDDAVDYYMQSPYYHDVPSEVDVWVELINMIQRQGLKVDIQREVLARETNTTNRRLLRNQLELERKAYFKLIDRRERQKERIDRNQL